MSNFAFLQTDWSLLHESATNAETAAHSDPRASCFYARRSLELAVQWIYKHDSSLKRPYQDNLAALLHEPGFKDTIGPALLAKAKIIRDLGNLAVHSTKKITPADSLATTRELFHLCFWLARTYGQRNRPAPGLSFAPALLPPAGPNPPAPQTRAQLEALEAQLRANDEKISTLLSDKAALDQELRALRAEVATAKQANAAQPDTHDYNEEDTRNYLIDLLLKESGWQPGQNAGTEVELEGMPSPSGKGRADYVLWDDDGKPLAVVEAKRTKRDATAGQQQAKLYADCLERQTGQRPLIFYSNGYEHWLWDDQRHPPRKVQGFYSKDALQLAVQRRASRKSLADADLNPAIAGRAYQIRAVRRVAESFERDHQRRALLVMATGAGKTRTVASLADLLVNCNWAKRILFLADRRELVKQAIDAFKKHLPNSSPVNLLRERDGEGRVFVSTYGTMMGLIDAFSHGQRRFGVGHFDLVIIDEAHRSVYQKYGAIFQYFDSLLVGLTATPTDQIGRDTYALFDLEPGVPTDAYPLDQAVADRFLVPAEPISVPLRFQRDGIKYDELSEDEKEQWDSTEWDADGATPSEVDAEAINNWLFNIDTVDKVLAHLMRKGQHVAGGDRLGKTIVFAKNVRHANFIAARFDANYPQHKGSFARVITHDSDQAQTLLDAFKTDGAPHIAISVDMLDTGIDVPAVLNLVFFKRVHSQTKFWQMLGRGTRLCEDLFGPGENKKFFYIFDYCQNLEFFNQNPEFSEGSASEPLGKRLFKARLDLIGALDRKFASTCPPIVAELRAGYGGNVDEPALRSQLAEFLRIHVAAMNFDNFVVRPQRRLVEKYARPESWDRLGGSEFAELAQDLAGLPTQVSDDDEDAKRFDLLLLRAQLAVLQAQPDWASLREKIQAIASALEAQEAIPAVRQQMVLIQQLAGDEWWQDVTVPMLELARHRLRALVKLIEKSKKKVVYTNFEDEMGEGVPVALPGAGIGLDMERFKDKARQFLRAHENHLSLQRLRRNQPLTPSDLLELERMLAEAAGSHQIIDQVKRQNPSLGVFIRNLVGLERDAVLAALQQFIASAAAPSANQIEFIEHVVTELTEKGVMDKRRLYESPFHELSGTGPETLFGAATLDKLMSALDDIRLRAAA